MKVFNGAKTYKINEIAETRSLRDFLLAINSIDLKFNLIYTTDLLNTVYSTTIIEQMLTLIEKFRHIIRMEKKTKQVLNFISRFPLIRILLLLFFLFLIRDLKKKINVHFFEENQSNHFNAQVKKSIDFLNVST